MNRKSCEGCRYFRSLSMGEKYCICHYTLDTGQSRGCDAAHCDKYSPLISGETLPNTDYFDYFEQEE